MKKSISRNIFHPQDVKLSKDSFVVEFTKKQEEEQRAEELKKEKLRQSNIKDSLKEKNEIEAKISILQEKYQNLLIALKDEKLKQKEQLEEKKQDYLKELEANKALSKEEATREKESIITDANTESSKIIQEARDKETEIKEVQKKLGYEEGFSKGYDEGIEERERVETFLKTILKEAIDKRDQIMDRFQQHLVDVVLLIVRKIVKKIANKDEMVVIENINACLKKIQGPVNLTIRVNISQLKKVKQLKANLLKSFSNIKEINLVEDPTIDPGGCIIDTEFMLIDGTIHSQLEKIEKQISTTKII